MGAVRESFFDDPPAVKRVDDQAVYYALKLMRRFYISNEYRQAIRVVESACSELFRLRDWRRKADEAAARQMDLFASPESGPSGNAHRERRDPLAPAARGYFESAPSDPALF